MDTHCGLFVAVKAEGCENKDYDIGFLDFIDQTMFLADSTAPLP